MDNRRNFPRIIVRNIGMQLRATNGDGYDIVNASEGGLCLRRKGGEKVTTGTPFKGHLSWPEKRIEHDIDGRIVWSRVYDDGDAFYGMVADIDFLMEALAPFLPEDVEPDPTESGGGKPGGARVEDSRA